MVPRQARAACRDTLAGCNLGVDLCPFWGYPDLALAYFACPLCRPFSANRAGTRRLPPRRDQDQPSGWNGLRLAEVRRSPPLPPHGHTFQPDIHRDFFPAFITPNLSFRGFFLLGCVTRANLGWPRAGSVIPSRVSTHTLALAHRQRSGFAPPSCNRLAGHFPTPNVPARKVKLHFGISTLVFFYFYFFRLDNGDE